MAYPEDEEEDSEVFGDPRAEKTLMVQVMRRASARTRLLRCLADVFAFLLFCIIFFFCRGHLAFVKTFIEVVWPL